MALKSDCILSKNEIEEFSGGADLTSWESTRPGICNERTRVPRRSVIGRGGVAGSGPGIVISSDGILLLRSGDDRGRRLVRGGGGSTCPANEDDARGGGEAIEYRGAEAADTNDE